MQKTAGRRRAAHRLIASCHSPSDDPPSPMNDTATRADALAREGHRHAGNRQRADRRAEPAAEGCPSRSRRCAGPCRSSAGRALAICAFSTIRTVAASARIASATPRSRMIGPTTSPCQRAVGAAIARAPAQPDGRRVDCLLPERPESLALKRRAAVVHLAAREELLEPVVHGAGEHHAAQDLAPLVGGQRGRNRLACEEAVAGIEKFAPRPLRSARAPCDAGRRVGKVPTAIESSRASALCESALESSTREQRARRFPDAVGAEESASWTGSTANGKRSRTKDAEALRDARMKPPRDGRPTLGMRPC